MARHAPPATGFTLVEVLVALVVLSVGLLGLAALHLESLRASRTALLRTQAVLLAVDMTDRVRANRHPADAYDCAGPCVAGAGGNPVAVEDIAAWRSAVATTLPRGQAVITYTAAAAGTPTAYVVGIRWHEAGGRVASSVHLRVER